MMQVRVFHALFTFITTSTLNNHNKMRIFYGNNHEKWNLNLTWAKAEKIAEVCERPDSTPEKRKTYDLFNMTDTEQAACFNLYDPTTGRLILKHMEHLVNVIYILCEEQCVERGISDKEFGEMMGSGLFGNAYAALMEEVVNFIPDSERREMFRMLLILADGKQAGVLRNLNQTLTQELTAMDAQITQITDVKLGKAFEQMKEALAKVAEENTTTTSSNSAVQSVPFPTNSLPEKS